MFTRKPLTFADHIRLSVQHDDFTQIAHVVVMRRGAEVMTVEIDADGGRVSVAFPGEPWRVSSATTTDDVSRAWIGVDRYLVQSVIDLGKVWNERYGDIRGNGYDPRPAAVKTLGEYRRSLPPTLEGDVERNRVTRLLALAPDLADIAGPG